MNFSRRRRQTGRSSICNRDAQHESQVSFGKALLLCGEVIHGVPNVAPRACCRFPERTFQSERSCAVVILSAAKDLQRTH